MLRSFLALTLAASCGVCFAEDRSKRGCGDPPGYSDTPVLPGQTWKVHDIARPHPPRVEGKPVLVPPPADATVLFDGKDLSKWYSTIDKKQAAPQWKVANGAVEVSGKGDLISREKFGDMQLHLEWQAPATPEGCGQWRGNSGVIIMGRYEIQVLDTYNNKTYADGQAAAMYGQFPPLSDSISKPGEWNSYDIVFKAPRFENGKVAQPPVVTVIHNGVVVHNQRPFIGQMAHRIYVPLKEHGPEESLVIQNHDATMRFRNIWIRRLGTN
jgi:hypothetical protein